jgi:hypothetical protein
MKKGFSQFFIWCAGSDTDILNKCPQFEKTKHAGYGILVCIPAVLAFFSMSYAISTLTTIAFWVIFAGVIWSLIIFSVDRFMVSTFKKSESVKKDLTSRSFFLRLFLASILGVALSHPFVLLYFNSSITQALNENLRTEISKKRREADSLSQSLSARVNLEIIKSDSAKLPIYQRIKAINDIFRQKEKLIECKRQLLTAEQSGIQLTLECGSSSKELGYNKRAIVIQEQINQELDELKKLKEEYKPQLDLYNEQISLIDSSLSITLKDLHEKIPDIDSTKFTEIENIQQNFSRDYLARESVLFGRMAHEHPWTIWVTSLVIMLVFFVIDIVAVSLKVLVNRGPYDDKLDEVSIEYSSNWNRVKNSSQMRNRAEEEFFRERASQIYQQALEVEEKAQAKEKIVEDIFKYNRKFNQTMLNEHINFVTFYFSNMERIQEITGNGELKDEELKMLKDLKEIFYQNSKIARDEYKSSN